MHSNKPVKDMPWFLAGHLFYKRLSVPKRTRSTSGVYQIQNENDQYNSLISTMTQNGVYLKQMSCSVYNDENSSS